MKSVVVSVNRYDLIDYTCVQSLKNIDWTTVGCLIYNSSKDDDVKIVLELTKIGAIVPKVIYIN